MTSFDLTGRVALITGSSRGIGFGLAVALSGAGATVVLNGRNPDTLAEARERIKEQTDGDVRTACFDAAAADSVRAGIAELLTTVSGIDILVNNTGTQLRAPMTELSDADWRLLTDTNLSSAFFVSRALAPQMIARGSGKIVNICSLQSELARPGIAAYAATKGGLKMLTKGLCADLAGHGIQVNGIGPGYFATELTAALTVDPDFDGWVRRRTPARRWGQIEDLAGAIIFLSSGASDFVNGQILYVDGGMSAVV